MSLAIDSLARFAMTTGEFGWFALAIFILGFVGVRFWARRERAAKPAQSVQQVFNIVNSVLGPERVVHSTTIDRIEAITQAEYEALAVKDKGTVYLLQ